MAKSKVWHIFRFEERFEMKEKSNTCRQGPLIYVREYVGVGSDDESIGYKQQMMILKQSPNRHLLRSVWDELRELAATRSRLYRGYLLDESLKPMADKRVALLCGMELDQCRSVLKELEDIGLIEKVPLPKFDESPVDEPPTPPADDPKEEPSQKPKKKTTKKKTSKKAAGDVKKAASADSPEISGDFGENPDALLKKEKESEDNDLRSPISDRCQKKEKNKSIESMAKPDGQEPTSQPSQTETQGTGTSQSPPSTLSAQSTGSPGTDGLGEDNIVLEDEILKLFSPSAFAQNIFIELGVPHDLPEHRVKANLSAFETLWRDAVSRCGFNKSELFELRDKGIFIARELCKKRRRKPKSANNWESVWMSRFKESIGKMQCRDGPEDESGASHKCAQQV